MDIADPRGSDRFLRLSWRAERREIIVSLWREGVCVATAQVGAEHFADIIGFVTKALNDVALQPSRPHDMNQPDRLGSRIRDRVRAWLRPRLAPVVGLAEHHVFNRLSGRRSA